MRSIKTDSLTDDYIMSFYVFRKIQTKGCRIKAIAILANLVNLVLTVYTEKGREVNGSDNK